MIVSTTKKYIIAPINNLFNQFYIAIDYLNKSDISRFLFVSKYFFLHIDLLKEKKREKEKQT